MKDFNTQVIEEFRANAGKVGGPFQGAAMILITAKGAKSGEPRTFPLVYTTDGDRPVIIASKGGAPTHPDWYYNLVKNPDVTVEIGTEKFQANAIEAQGAERDRLFADQAAIMPNFAEYAEKTKGIRTIPVFVIERIG
jgi:deazaflavin-dependent oxidoreductase (nitroreductase family)